MYSPAEVARRYVETGKEQGAAALPVGRILLLGMLAGAFIAWRGIGHSLVELCEALRLARGGGVTGGA